VAGSAGNSDDLFVKVYDGHVYTDWSEFHVNVAAPAVNHAPVLIVPSANVSASAGQSIAASGLFSASDADNDTLTYYLYDNSVATSGGHFVVNGTVVPSDLMYTVSAAQLLQTAFVAGSAGNSDDLFVKVYDGHVYTDWSEFHVNVAAPAGPASPETTALGNFVFALEQGSRNSKNFIQSGAADDQLPFVDQSADHGNHTDTASVVTLDYTKLESGIHLDAATDPLALFGMHATDHFVF
jgi:hypothetical protein